ncbi:MAG TPA: AAA family ATPase [Candidatus Paceibacterota bacterium]|nr:AAA family ATPase [Candidatus Paceibacterota bacterium]
MKWTLEGFPEQKKLFESLIEKGALAHAYLFSGPAAVGKHLFAENIFVLANNRPAFDPADPDLRLIRRGSEESHISIEAVRPIKQFVSLSAFKGPYKFIIIDEAETLTDEAVNALLKVLEEPAAKRVFFLISGQPDQLPHTIVSRCQEIRFAGHDPATIERALAKSKLVAEDKALIAELAQGRLGWAIEMNDKTHVKKIKKAIDEFSELLNQPLAARLAYAKRIYEKEEYVHSVPYWLMWAYARRETLPNAPRILSQLLTLHARLGQSQYNHRLLLENTLINL